MLKTELAAAVAGEFASRLPASRIRWRRTEAAILSAEIAAVLREKEAFWAVKKSALLVGIVKLYAEHPDWFVVTAPNRPYAAGLGRAVAVRTNPLSDKVSKADTMLKLWSRSSAQQFTGHYLPPLLRIAARNGDVKLNLGALLNLVLDWDEKRPAVIAAIADEYFMKTSTKEKTEA